MYKMIYTRRIYDDLEITHNDFDFIIDHTIRALRNNDITRLNLYQIINDEMNCILSFDCHRMSYYTIYAAGYDLIDNDTIQLIHDAIRNR